MICFQVDRQSILNGTVNSWKIRKRQCLKKRPELRHRWNVVFLMDNARPHIALATKEKLKDFGLEVI